VQQRSIGNDTVGRVSVGAIGLGAMPLSTKEPRPSPTDAETVVHAALDAGVTLIDTADAYAYDEAEFGHNEQLVADALRSYGRVDVLVATKGGHTRRGTDWGSTDRRPTCGAPVRPRCGGCTWTRSGSTSSTGPTPRRRGRSR
jgi:aryl-alcohol dehydrogenase-like predicted oxidoreductase